MAKRRQIYGGKEADEYRATGAILADRIRENEIAEGKEVGELRALLQDHYSNPADIGKKKAVEDYLKRLADTGFHSARIASIYTRASARLKIPETKKSWR